jgi:hypothetical protein
LARLTRDGRTDLLEQIKDGTLSVRRAAIKAGYMRDLSPLDKILRLWAKLTPAERQRFLKEIN